MACSRTAWHKFHSGEGRPSFDVRVPGVHPGGHPLAEQHCEAEPVAVGLAREHPPPPLFTAVGQVLALSQQDRCTGRASWAGGQGPRSTSVSPKGLVPPHGGSQGHQLGVLGRSLALCFCARTPGGLHSAKDTGRQFPPAVPRSKVPAVTVTTGTPVAR
jgi:hypothetical protein